MQKAAMMVLAGVLGLLSVAAGAAKIALVPEETEFLAQFGFTEPLTIAFGAVQVLGGLLLFIPSKRLPGGIVVAIGFTLSAVLILINGNLAFAALSAIPVALSGLLVYISISGAPMTRLEADE